MTEATKNTSSLISPRVIDLCEQILALALEKQSLYAEVFEDTLDGDINAMKGVKESRASYPVTEVQFFHKAFWAGLHPDRNNRRDYRLWKTDLIPHYGQIEEDVCTSLSEILSEMNSMYTRFEESMKRG